MNADDKMDGGASSLKKPKKNKKTTDTASKKKPKSKSSKQSKSSKPSKKVKSSKPSKKVKSSKPSKKVKSSKPSKTVKSKTSKSSKKSKTLDGGEKPKKKIPESFKKNQEMLNDVKKLLGIKMSTGLNTFLKPFRDKAKASVKDPKDYDKVNDAILELVKDHLKKNSKEKVISEIEKYTVSSRLNKKTKEKKSKNSKGSKGSKSKK